MKIKELFDKGIRKIRLPQWNPSAYAEIYDAGNGSMGPWLTLYDIDLSNPPESLLRGVVEVSKVLVPEVDSNDWEEVN